MKRILEQQLIPLACLGLLLFGAHGLWRTVAEIIAVALVLFGATAIVVFVFDHWMWRHSRRGRGGTLWPR